MPKNSFRHPVTNVLTCWGYVESNAPGEIKQAESDNFALAIGDWQWNGSAWVPFTPPVLTPTQQLAADTAPKWVRALVVYLGQIQVPTKTPTQVFSDLLTIYTGLP